MYFVLGVQTYLKIQIFQHPWKHNYSFKILLIGSTDQKTKNIEISKKKSRLLISTYFYLFLLISTYK